MIAPALWDHRSSTTCVSFSWLGFLPFAQCRRRMKRHLQVKCGAEMNDKNVTIPSASLPSLSDLHPSNLSLFNHSFMSSSFHPHGLQHSRFLSTTICRSFLTFMSIEPVMLSKYLILCHSFFLLPSVSQHQGLFQWVGSLHQLAKVFVWLSVTLWTAAC